MDNRRFVARWDDDEELVVRVVFSCWMGTIVSTSTVSIEDLVGIVLRYYQMPQFEWVPLQTHSDVTLLSDKKTLQFEAPPFWGGYKTAVAKPELCSETMSSVLWEVTLYDITSPINYFMLGFVDSCAVEDVREGWCLGQKDRPKECAIGIYSHCFSKCAKGKEWNFDSKWKGSDCSNLDRILLEFDFVHNLCTVYYNEEYVGVLPETLPNRLFIVRNMSSSITLETTKFAVRRR